eukprot:COSAG01_NODE_17595_length_1138_cov_2.156882_1_plen_250_part_00
MRQVIRGRRQRLWWRQPTKAKAELHSEKWEGAGGQGRLSGSWGTACLRRAAAAREPAMVAAPPNKIEQPTHSVVVSSYAGRKGRVAWKTHRRAAPGCSPCACAATNAAAAAPSLRTTPPPPAAWTTSVARTGTITCYAGGQVLQRVWGARARALCAGSGRSSSRAMWVVGGGQGRHERRGEVHLPGLPALAPRRQVGRLAGAGSTRNRPGLSAWCLPLSEAPSTVPPSLLRGPCGVSRPCETVSGFLLR